MRVIALGVREFRSNYRRNAIFGIILLVAVATQMVTALSETGSREAVTVYGNAAFGYAETFAAGLSKPINGSQLEALNESLGRFQHSYPWFRPATATDLSVKILDGHHQNPSTAQDLTLRAVSGNWWTLSAALPNDDVWRTLTSPRLVGAAVLLDSQVSRQWNIQPGQPISILQPPVEGGDGGVDLSAGVIPGALQNVPVLGVYTELNRSLSADGLASQNLVTLLHTGPQQATVYWRCEESRCVDSAGLVHRAATSIGAVPSSANRVDQLGQFAPVLQQQQQNGRRIAFVVLLLGALAVAIVSTAFVEIRAPEFATLRTLGASRSAIAAVCLLENLLTAGVVALMSTVIGTSLTRINPNWFNRIPQITLTQLNPPVGLYLRLVSLTLLIGLVTGLFPAFRAYRAVRAN
jgi:putative ABC transport system permease protein